MSNWISFPNYPPMEMLLRPCSNVDQFVPSSLYQEDQWLPLDLTSQTLTDRQDSPSSITIGGDQNLHQVLPVGVTATKSASVSSESTEVTMSANGKSPESLTVVDSSVRNVKQLTAEEGMVTAVTSPVKAFGHRSSIYRGVTKHRWTGRYEAHLWDNTCRIEGQKRKGRQVYLGGYDIEEKAARAYDLAALKYWGPSAATNFPVSDYSKEMEIMNNMTQPEFIASIRRNSSGFSRGASIYRGVTRHHQQGRWQARIGRVAGNKDLYLGTFSTEEEAAEAYDIAAIKFRGSNAVTNFELSRYNVEAIANNELPVGSSTNRRRKTAILEPKHTNFELNQYNIQAVADSKQLTIASTKRTKHAFEGNNYNLTPLAITSSNAAVSNLDLSMYNLEGFTNNEQMVAFEGITKPEVTMTTNSIDNSVSLAYYGMGETMTDPCGQGLYWFGGNGQYNTGQINQLTLEASQ